jgi:hypothetical protein
MVMVQVSATFDDRDLVNGDETADVVIGDAKAVDVDKDDDNDDDNDDDDVLLDALSRVGIEADNEAGNEAFRLS